SLDIIEVAGEFKPVIVATLYFMLGHSLDLGWFREQINDYPVETHWDALAREAIRDELDLQHRTLSIGVLKTETHAKSIDTQINTWMEKHHSLVERWRHTLTEMRTLPAINYVMLSVAVRELSDLSQTTRQLAMG
ncbi:MAG: NAD-glutamate dehydrogenase, partial [Gammaproteobacteria bacterium]|nr:NAD-glutamate dehydrogenase [Gammaproteobacteria bacterium]